MTGDNFGLQTSTEVRRKSGHPLRRRPRRRRRGSTTGLLFVLPSVVIFAVLLAYPIGYAVRLSFMNFSLFSPISHYVGLANYLELFHDSALLHSVINDLVWTAGSLLGELGLGLAAALLINRAHPAMVWVRLVLLMPYVVPTVAIALIWRWMLDGKYGVLTHWMQQLHLIAPGQSPLDIPAAAMVVVIVIDVWRGFPFSMLIYWAALQGIDSSQYEAAKLDGAGSWDQFRYVTFPGLRNATLTLLALRGIWTFTYFDLVWLVTQGGPARATTILPTYIYQVAFGSFNFSYASAITVATAVVIMLLVLLVLMARRLRTRATRAGRALQGPNRGSAS